MVNRLKPVSSEAGFFLQRLQILFDNDSVKWENVTMMKKVKHEEAEKLAQELKYEAKKHGLTIASHPDHAFCYVPVAETKFALKKVYFVDNADEVEFYLNTTAIPC